MACTLIGILNISNTYKRERVRNRQNFPFLWASLDIFRRNLFVSLGPIFGFFPLSTDHARVISAPPYPVKLLLRPSLLIDRNLAGIVGVDRFGGVPGDLGDHRGVKVGFPEHAHNDAVPKCVAVPAVGVHPELFDNLFYGETHAPERSAEEGVLLGGIGLDVFPQVVQGLLGEGKDPGLGILSPVDREGFGGSLQRGKEHQARSWAIPCMFMTGFRPWAPGAT